MDNRVVQRRTLLGLCMVAALLSAAPSAALDPRRRVTQYGQDSWTNEAGLPQNSVYAITQTRDGYMWLGTWEGLVRFDGVTFTVFDKHNTPELHGQNVVALAEDADGVLWVGTDRGVVAYAQGRFRRPSAEGELANAEVRSLAVGPGALWVGTTSGLVRLPLSGDGPGRPYTPEGGKQTRIVNSLAFDAEGTLWVGTAQGLLRLADDTLRPEGSAALRSAEVSAVRQGRDGTLWVGTATGLHALRDGKDTAYGVREGLPDAYVTTLWEDRDGNLWVGHKRGGVTRWAGGTFASLGPSTGFPDIHVLALTEDRDGHLWLGTHAGGLVRLRDGAFVTYGLPEGLTNEAVFTVMEDRAGTVWVGTRGGGLQGLRKDGQVTHVGAAEGLTADTISALAEAPDGSLWVGTFSGVFHQEGARFTHLGRAEGLPHDIVVSVLADSRGDVWLGTAGGLARLHAGTLTTLGVAQGVPERAVVAMVEDAAGVVWFGSHAGLLRYADGTFTRYTTEEGLAGNEVMSLYAAPGGAVWVGTSTGLSRVKDGHLWRFTTEQGLFDDAAFSVVPDDEGHLWMSCNRGVSRVSIAELEAVAEGQRDKVRPTAFDTRDGMRGAECNGNAQPSGWRGKDGRLWFTTVRGAVAVDPRDVRPNPKPPEVRIETVLVQGRPVAPGAGTLELPPGSRDVEVRFTGFSPEDTARLPFRYRLKGHDEGWVAANGRRSVTYSSLAPGHYRFEVSAANRDGVWAEPGAVVALHLQPYFHQTPWFYALCLLGAGGLVAGLYRLRVERLQARERWLEEKVEERTRELARANEVLEENMRTLRETQAQLLQAGKMAAVGTLAAGVGHEINNPLAYILSNLEFANAELARFAKQEEAHADKGPRWRELEQALREALLGADRVRRIVKDLKTFSRGDEEARGPVDLNAVLDSAAKIAANELRHRGRLVKDYGAVPPVEGNEARLGQVFLNLLINAAQALPEGQAEQHEVRLVTKHVDGRVVAEVHDTGCGIPPELQSRIFDPFFTTKPVGVGTGLGLALCHAFLSGMGGDIAVESQPGHTVFRVTLPAARGEEPRVVAEASPDSPRVRGRVLVVDDDALVSASLRRTLSREHEVEVVASARQALELLKSPEGATYDVVLCDLMMPDMTGMELYAQLEAALPAVASQVVFVTGGAFTPGAQAFLERVRNARLEKPFEPEKLRELVRARVQARIQAA